MPELPDVEIFRRHYEETARGRRIARVEVSDRRILAGPGPAALARALVGRPLGESRRHGKHLLIHVGADGWLALHFGMSGSLAYYARAAEEPAFVRLRLDLAGGGHLGYVSRRLLGHVGMVEDAGAFIAAEGLGPDALDPGLDLARFKALLAGRRGAVKAALMDQSLVAGIGNIYSDEILFQARIHPKAPLPALDDGARARLHRALRRVLGAAVAAKAGSEIALERLPRGFLIPHRRRGGHCPRCGEALGEVKVGGRTGYFCPRCQPEPG